ncbi:nuclear transport factor 2 family protein [Mesorhizobium sp. ANAO-SY3R2]|uniref:nuclear transport factor 2 family protein n=1 Tax=Mesorhizobium sp. ANAO-SY3R2 TaxID=3166644 RepID=UPI00367209D2
MQSEDIVRTFYADYLKRDIDAAVAQIADNVTFDWKVGADHIKEYTGSVVGKQAFRDRLKALDAEFDYIDIDIFDFVASEDRAAVQIKLTMRHRKSQREFVIPIADFWTLRDGKVVEFAEYYDTALAQSILAGAPAEAAPMVQTGEPAVEYDELLRRD